MISQHLCVVLGGCRCHLPSIIVLGSRYASTGEDELRLHVHVLPGREDGAVSDHEVLNDVGVGDGDEELVSDDEGEEAAVLLRPSIEGELRVLRQMCKTT